MIWTTTLILLLAAVSSNAQDGSMMMQFSEEDKPYLLTYSNLDDPQGRIVLRNEHVVLQRLVVPAGEWEGVHSHPGNQLYVHIKGGFWSGKMGGELVYSHELDGDGAVGWMDTIPFSAGHDSGNTGDASIDLIYVNLKSDTPIAPDGDHAPQNYPNIPLNLVFENDRVIAQRGQIEPGQWTGPHSRPGNQLYILVKGGNLSERSGGNEGSVLPLLEDGTPRWLDAIPTSEEYEFGNTGETTMYMVLITIK